MMVHTPLMAQNKKPLMAQNKKPLMALDKVTLVNEGTVLCKAFSLDIYAGDRIAILGPNGSGKTTLLHTLAGLQQAHSGDILLQQKNISHWNKLELARHLGLLFQTSQDDMPATVMENVLLGRLPHQRAWQSTQDADWQASMHAMQKMDLLALADREIGRLSGGERQRAAIAALLAQAPLIYLLDEPTNHLDISFQIKCMQLFSKLALTEQRTIMMATHDINLACRFCDRILLLGADGEIMAGSVSEIMTESRLSAAFSFDIRRISNDGQQWFYPGGFDSRHKV